ncbi:MAG: hypothetical protein ACTSU3_10315 [Candidatus Thorarchaeota archaeon]
MEKLERVLQLLGVNLKQGKWRILQVILSSQEELGAGITFDVLKKGIEELEGKKVARPLIYRYLKELEENGILYIDRTSRTNRYVIDEETVIQSLQTSRAIVVSDLKKDLRTTTAKHDILSEISADRLKDGFIESLTGKKVQDTTQVGTNLDEIRKIIYDKIFSRTLENDIVRFSLEYETLIAIMDDELIRSGVKLASKKIKFQVLVTESDTMKMKERVLSSTRLSVKSREQLIMEFRISPKTTRTYQSISLNEEGIILVVSANPLSAIWIPRSQNKLLVEDVISGFKQNYSEAVRMEI